MSVHCIRIRRRKTATRRERNRSRSRLDSPFSRSSSAVDRLFERIDKMSSELDLKNSTEAAQRQFDSDKKLTDIVRACLKKLSLHILAEKFLNDLLGILPENVSFYISQILMTFFSHRPFLGFQPFSIKQISPISYCLNTLYPLYAHRHAVLPFLHLTFYSHNSKYYIRLLFLLTSSLHKQSFITFSFIIAHFVHHCTFEQALDIARQQSASVQSQ